MQSHCIVSSLPNGRKTNQQLLSCTEIKRWGDTAATTAHIYLCKLARRMVAVYDPGSIYRKNSLQKSPRVSIMLNVGTQ
jgi:hypothetical protein